MVVYANNNYSDIALEKAIEKADSFFMCLKTIALKKRGENVFRKVLDLTENFFVFPSEQKAPNEFNELGFPNNYKYGISVSRYVAFFREMFNDERFKNVSFNYTVIRNECHVIKGIEIQEDKTEPLFAGIVVRKTYNLPDSVLKIFSDTLVFNLENLKIVQWTNDAQTLSGGHQVHLMFEHINDREKYENNKPLNLSLNYINRKKRK